MSNSKNILSVETIASNFSHNVVKQLIIKEKAGLVITDQIRLIIGIKPVAEHKGLKAVERVHITPETIEIIQKAYTDATGDKIAESTQSQYRTYIGKVLRAIKDNKRDLVEQALDGCNSPQNVYKRLKGLLDDTSSNGPNDPSGKTPANPAPVADDESVDNHTSVDHSKASIAGFDCTVRGCSDDDFIVQKLYLQLSRDGGAIGVLRLAKKLAQYSIKQAREIRETQKAS